MFIIELFRLFGSIMIDNDQANASISDTDRRAQGTTKTFGKMLGTAAKVGAGIALAMGTAAIAVGGLAVKFSEDLQKSLNGVQAATGIADEHMVGMKDTMISIYNNNFGENFEEIGAAMTLINQQTGLAGEALQSMTEDALALKDTFDMEVADSLKGANQLMKQFGMDGDTAYNLIAQGAQGGLDANGDLIDTLNEYSGTFKAQGFSAEEMFNMLSNGAASGVRDVDLLADAVKEFGIRSKDGSDATAQAFKDLGLNSDALTKSFGKGGEEGKKAFEGVTNKLIAMKDPVKQNELGVALFGTQFEDLGIKGVTALVNTQGEINKSVDALGKINAVKYDTAAEAFEGIKRNLETSILVPLGEKIMPKINEFAAWILENMPKIKNEIEYAMTTAGKAIENIGKAITGTKEFFEEYWEILVPILAGVAAGAITFGVITLATKAWTAATKLAKAAQAALSLVMSLSPIGKVILLVGLLVAAGVALYQNWDIVKDKASDLWVAIKNAFRKGVNGAIGLINKLIKQINKIPGVNAPLISRIELEYTNNSKAKTMDDRLGNSGYKPGNNAQGTDYWRGGLTWVGEEGPEIVRLPRGSQVIPNDKAMAGGGITLYIQNLYNNRKQDVEELAQELEMYRQMHSKALGGGA